MKNKTISKKISLLVKKKVIAFDLDGTLTKSKEKVSKKMGYLLCLLLQRKVVVITGGGSWKQFHKQLLVHLPCKNFFDRLLILPTSGAELYTYRFGKWKKVYRKTLSYEEKYKIKKALLDVLDFLRYQKPTRKYGEVIEDRKTQITFSALGQNAPLLLKKKWYKKNNNLRKKMKMLLQRKLPEFEVKLGGLTSIDITRKGVNKATGLEAVCQMLKLNKENVVYVGDALYQGGNDYVVKAYGFDTIKVKDEQDTMNIIESAIKFL